VYVPVFGNPGSVFPGVPGVVVRSFPIDFVLVVGSRAAATIVVTPILTSSSKLPALPTIRVERRVVPNEHFRVLSFRPEVFFRTAVQASSSRSASRETGLWRRTAEICELRSSRSMRKA